MSRVQGIIRVAEWGFEPMSFCSWILSHTLNLYSRLVSIFFSLSSELAMFNDAIVSPHFNYIFIFLLWTTMTVRLSCIFQASSAHTHSEPLPPPPHMKQAGHKHCHSFCHVCRKPSFSLICLPPCVPLELGFSKHNKHKVRLFPWSLHEHPVLPLS